MLKAFIEHLSSNRIQYLSIFGSLWVLWNLVQLIRKRKIREEYSLLWLFFGLVFLLFSIFRPGLELIAKLVGIVYAPAALLLMLVLAVFFILIQYSVVISKLTDNNKNLVQEVGLLRMELEDLKKKINGDKPNP